MKFRDVVGDDARVTTRSKPDRKPDITIVTPTYRRNSEGLLLKCLQSALDQTFTNFEHIIIDDGSSDGTEELVLRLCEQDERIVYVRHDKNSGLPAVRTNEGILRARGRAVAFLFDDNVLKPEFLTEAWNLLNQSGADVVHGEVDIPTTSGKPFVLGGWPLTLDLMRCLNTIANGGVLIRLDFFDRFGLYDPHLAARRLCDWELWVRSLWLGAQFRHLPLAVAEEGGLVSPNSLGNTVAIDWKAVYGYLQDTRYYHERSLRFRPSAIVDANILDTDAVRRYVRDEAEWRVVIDQIYRPYLDRQAIDYDPALYTNRVASVDPLLGWNPDWALFRRRFRVLFLTNALPGLVASMIESVREIPGAIVVNCPDWQFSTFDPGSIDIIFVVDAANPNIKGFLDAHREKGTRIAYLSFYGEQRAADAPFGFADYGKNKHVISIFGEPPPYFPQPGHGHQDSQIGIGIALRDYADLVVTSGVPRKAREVSLPNVSPPELVCEAATGSRIAYRLASGTASGSATELVTRTDDQASGRVTSETLASLVISRSGAEIIVEPSDLAKLPRAELIGLGCLASRQNVSVTSAGVTMDRKATAAARAMSAAYWDVWLANIARVLRLQQRLNLPPRKALTVDIYLMSELFSGSEAYGLGIAKCLHEIGVEVRVRVPDKSVYGGDHIAVNDWLSDNGVPLATRAPYIQGAAWTMREPGERATTLDELTAFITCDPSDLIIASGYIPHLAHLRQRPPLFMALFSPAAYDQRELIDLRGRVDGLLSDSQWALGPSSAVIGARGRVVRSTTFGSGGEQVERVVTRDRAAPVRIAVAGTLQVRKRQLEAVRAVGILRRRGYNVELNLYGYALEMLREYIDRVDAAIVAEGLQAYAKRHGFVEDGARITRDNDIVLSASTDESLPQGLLFQMYQGLIGVAVVCGGIDEIIRDGHSGYLTNDATPQSIADVLARAIDDRDRWRDIATTAHRLIFNECGVANTTAGILELLEEGVALRAPTVTEPAAAFRPVQASLAPAVGPLLEPVNVVTHSRTETKSHAESIENHPGTASADLVTAARVVTPLEAKQQIASITVGEPVATPTRGPTVAPAPSRPHATKGREVVLQFSPRTDGIAGVAVRIPGAHPSSVRATLASRHRPDIVLREATIGAALETDRNRRFELRWDPLANSEGASLVLKLNYSLDGTPLGLWDRKPKIEELHYS